MPGQNEIEQRAFLMWCDQGKPDGEQMVDFGLGEKKLCEYHWLIAKLQWEMESWHILKSIGPVETKLDKGYFYAPYVPLTKTPVALDPDVFQPRKGILSRYGKKILEEGKEHYGKMTLKDLDGPPTEEVTMEARPTPSPDYIEIELEE